MPSGTRIRSTCVSDDDPAALLRRQRRLHQRAQADRQAVHRQRTVRRARYCIDGVCCSSACNQTCYSCGLAGTEGSCQPIAGRAARSQRDHPVRRRDAVLHRPGDTHGEGVDAVFEMLGGEHTAKSLRCLRDFGRVIQYGTATGKAPQLDVRAMYAKSASVQGLWLTYLSQKREIMEPAWAQLSAWIAEGKLTPQIGHVFPLDRAIEAYKLLEDGKNYGKVVLKIA